MKLGVFGGTFNPPHNGHLIVLTTVREELGLDRVLLVPCAIPPHKPHESVPDGKDRLAMLSLAIQEDEGLAASAIELKRGGVSYTVDTLEELRHIHPEASLFLIIGMDNVTEFHTWKEPARIRSMATVVAMTRPGYPAGDAMAGVRSCPVPMIDISSTMIRERVKQNRSIRYLVPPGVEEYIARRGLYR